MAVLVIFKNAPAIAKLARTMNFKPHCKNHINSGYIEESHRGGRLHRGGSGEERLQAARVRLHQSTTVVRVREHSVQQLSAGQGVHAASRGFRPGDGQGGGDPGGFARGRGILHAHRILSDVYQLRFGHVRRSGTDAQTTDAGDDVVIRFGGRRDKSCCN